MKVTCKSLWSGFYTVFSLSDNFAIGIRGATLKALEQNMIIDVASIKRDRRRDGGNGPTRY